MTVIVQLQTAHFVWCFSVFSVLNVKAVVVAFNQEKALVGTFSVIMYTTSNFAGRGSGRFLGGDTVITQLRIRGPARS